MKLEGVHHVTAITGDAPRNVDFYARVLGLRLVKKSVNQDDPTVYHLFYGDEEGAPGNDITFFEYPGARRGQGRRRDGAHRRLAGRLARGGRLLGGPPGRRGHRRRALRGRRLRVPRPRGPAARADPGREPGRAAHRRPSRGAGASSRCRASTACAPTRTTPSRAAASSRRRSSSNRTARSSWEARGKHRGGLYLYDQSDERGVPGAGTVHHVAWASPTDEHEAWQRRVAESGASPTPVIDRYYFESIYFREPSGVLFEIATIGPGLHRRRAAGDARRAALAAAELRAPARPARGRADAAAGPARASRRQVTIAHLERPAEGEPAGLLVLFHGRGSDERDLFPLLDVLDPERRLLGVTPRGPLSLPPGGAHWYAFLQARLPGSGDVPRDLPAVAEWLDGFDFEHVVLGRLLAGRGDDLRARARQRAPTAGGAGRAERLHADGARLRARPGAAAAAGRDRPRRLRQR